MPIDSTHPQYDATLPIISKCRDAMEGEEAVKAAGTTYLPALSGQEDDEYRAYRSRATFYGATARTVEGLVGAIMAKAIQQTLPTALDEMTATIGRSGESLELMAENIVREVIGVGRAGIYVDASDEENADPYIVLYFAENIINWQTIVQEGRIKLSLVVLKEIREDVDDDGFGIKQVVQYRVLRLGDPEGRGKDTYFVQVWEKNETLVGRSKQEEWVLISEVIPKSRGGKPLDFIPFKFVGPAMSGPDVEKSPILDLVNVNLSHYRTSADLEHGRHWTALPTAWVAGFDTKQPLRVGSSVAWVAESPNAKAGYLEFTGAGLGHLAEGLRDKEKQMAVLGARLLEEQQKDAEAAATVRLRHSGEQVSLKNIAGSVSEALTQAMRWIALWKGIKAEGDSVIIKLNDDFNLERITPDQLNSLMLSYQQGLISWNTLYFNLERGGIYPDGTTIEEEEELISQGGPISLPGKGIGEGEDEFTEEDEEGA
jgi:hypothetical protein